MEIFFLLEWSDVKFLQDQWKIRDRKLKDNTLALVRHWWIRYPNYFLHKWLDQPLREELSSKLALLINWCTVHSLIFSWNNLIPFENWNERSITIWYIQYTDIRYNGKFVGNDVINAFHIHFQIWWMKRKDFVTM